MFTRRQFVQLCLKGMAAYSLSPLIIPRLAQALEAMGEKPVVLYMEANTCAGNFFSLMNTLNPSLRDLLFESLDIRYSNTLMTAQGEEALDILMETIEEGNYIVMVEGTIPTRGEGYYGTSALLGEEEITHLEMIRYIGSKAKTVIAVGTCAAFGGPYAAHPNPSHSLPVSKVLNRKVINVPGCPVHPDWVVGTLSHEILFGDPPLGPHNRPLLFYGENIHERCPRRQMYEKSIFARHPGEEGCLYLIGCKGPVTYSDCPVRQWIGLHNSWPVEANTPCIGCVNADFPEKSMPFFQHLPQVGVGGVNTTAQKFAGAAAGATALGIGAHFLATTFRGRLKMKLKGQLKSHQKEKGKKDE